MENGIPYILVSSVSVFPVFANLIRSQRSHDNVSSGAIAEIFLLQSNFPIIRLVFPTETKNKEFIVLIFYSTQWLLSFKIAKDQ